MMIVIHREGMQARGIRRVWACAHHTIKALKTCHSRPMFYIGEIGKVKDYYPRLVYLSEDNRHPRASDKVFKYGITHNIYRRVVREHKYNFNYFHVCVLKESFHHRWIERQFMKALKKRGLLLSLCKECDKDVHFKEVFFLQQSSRDVEWLNKELNNIFHDAAQLSLEAQIDINTWITPDLSFTL